MSVHSFIGQLNDNLVTRKGGMSVHSFIGQLNGKVHKSNHSVVSHDHRYSKQKSLKSERWPVLYDYGTFFDDL